jgi:GNAT superfamily N-acetyltransferase
VTATPERPRVSAPPDGVDLRPATESDVAWCAGLWRESINDYMARLGQPLIPDELSPVGRLHRHLHATDPDRFVVAVRDGDSSDRPIAFGAAVRREDVWFLSMLYVRPGEQGRGIGRAILDRILPTDGATLAAGTDSAQPISNALYAGLGIVPRMPLLSLIGDLERASELGDLPAGVVAERFDATADGEALATTIDALDREVLGFAHRQDHGYLGSEGREGFLYRGPAGVAVAYGYASPVGRVGPVAVRSPELLAPVIGHLLIAVPPRGASAVWAPGHATAAVVGLLRAGLRLDGFPVLFGWSRPFADFSRYIPISPGLL